MKYPLIKRTAHFIWISLAALIVLSACLLSAARLWLPMSTHYQKQIETWATHQLHIPVNIANIEAIWHGFQPTFKLKTVVVGEPGGRVSPFCVEELYVGVDLFQSLLHRQFILGRLKLTGVDLRLQVDGKGRFGIQDFSRPEKQSDIAIVQPEQGLHWLLQQRQLILSQVNIDIATQDGTSLHVRDLNLNLENSQKRHQLTVAAKINDNPNTQLQFIVKLFGRADQLEALRGKFYLSAKNINFLMMSNIVPALSDRIKGGEGKVELWGHIREGKVHKVQSKWLLHDLLFKKIDADYVINSLSGFVRWKHLKTGGWLLSSKKINMTVNNKPQGDNAFRLVVLDEDYTTQQTVTLYIKQFKLQAILPLVEHVFADKIQLSHGLVLGAIRQFNLSLRRYEGHVDDFSLGAYIDNLTVNGVSQLPTISGLSGYLKTDATQGNFEIYSQRMFVKFKHLFRNALSFSRLQGNVNWYLNDKGWHIVAPNLRGENTLAQAQANLALTFPANGDDIDIELLAHLQSNAFDNVDLKPHLPVGILSDPVVKWLDMALLRGGASDTTLALRGPVHRFPFDDNSGTFIVDSKIHDLDLAYYPHWPQATGLSGMLHFDGRSMIAKVNEGFVSGAEVKELVATIPYMGRHKPVILSLKGDAAGDLSHGQHYIQHSPLKSLFGESFNDIILSGPTHLDLALQIPIYLQNGVSVNGIITTKEGIFHYPKVGLEAKKIQGKLHFTEKGVKSQQLQGELFCEPVSIDIHSQPQQLAIDVMGKVAAQKLLENYKIHLNDFLQGAFKYTANVRLKHQGKNTLQVKSDLVNLTSQFPEPFFKKAAQSLPSQVNGIFDSNGLTVSFDYHHFAKGLLEFVNEKEGLGFSHGHITVDGDVPISQKLSGLLVEGDFERFNVGSWIDTIVKLQMPKQESPSGFSMDKILRKIRLHVQQANFMGYDYHNLMMTISPQLQAWKIQLQSEDLDGIVLVPNELSTQPIVGEFNYIHLLKRKESGSSVDFSTVPAIHFFAKQFQTKHIDLGQVTMETEKSPNSYIFKKISIENKAYQIQAQGRWEKNENKTLFSGRMKSNSVSHALDAWDLPDNLHGKNAKMDFTFHWLDAPSQFNLEKLNGDFSLRLSDGYIEGLGKDTDAKLGLGRIVTLFSLQSLPKRLQMDFRDLTHKGFYFDKLSGDFLLQQGNAKIDNLSLDGTVAHVELLGRVGLFAQDYDIQLSVMPHLTSSLPLMATIAGGPVAGIATWLVDKAVSPEVKKMTRHIYKVTGTWADPNIQQVE